MPSRVPGPYESWPSERLQQGDILRDVTVAEARTNASGSADITTRTFRYIVILSQDCDLLQDFDNRSDTNRATQDKYLQHIVFSPAYIATAFQSGKHLEELKLQMTQWKGGEWDKIIKNNNPRYHYLPSADDLQIPDLVLDFKHMVSSLREVLYSQAKATYRGTVAELYREQLATRLAHFFSRIALPDEQST